MIVDKCRHHGYGHDLATLIEQPIRFLVLHADHILSVDLEQLMLDQHAVPGSRRVFDDRRNTTVL